MKRTALKKSYLLLAALGLLTFMSDQVNGATFEVPISKKKVKGTSSSTQFGTIRDLNQVAKNLGLEVEEPPKKEQLIVGGVDVYELIPNLLSKWANNLNPRKTTTLDVLLTNPQNMAYYGDIFIGSNKQKLQVIYDTGSDYLVFGDSSCSNCVSKRFYSKQSSTYSVHDSAIIA